MIGTDRQGYVPGELISFSAEVGLMGWDILLVLEHFKAANKGTVSYMCCYLEDNLNS